MHELKLSMSVFMPRYSFSPLYSDRTSTNILYLLNIDVSQIDDIFCACDFYLILAVISKEYVNDDANID